MKKIFILLFLVNTIHLTPSFANEHNWQLVGENKTGSVTVYIDTQNIRYHKDTLAVVWWQLDSYREKMPVDNYTILSNMSKTEGDCLRDRRLDLYVVFFDQRMAKGNKVTVAEPEERKWVHDEKGSIYFKALRKVCSIALNIKN
tara:strand:+ start:246 stop:677 length:432 start_codon:yes stop_codon:yes gene_type:complete